MIGAERTEEELVVAGPVAVPEVVPATGEPLPRWRGKELRRLALRNRKLRLGLSVLLLLLAGSLVGPLFTDLGPWEFAGAVSRPPSSQHWLGTTLFGQDVFTQLVHGLRATFLLGAIAAAIASFIAMVVGFISGYKGGWLDELLSGITNVVLVLPTLAVLIIVGAYFNTRTIGLQAVLIGLTSWPWAARALRAQTFSLANREFVDMARLSGVSTWGVIRREIAPNMSSYLFMKLILLFGGAVLVAATLDFIGLGPTQGVSLGLMLYQAVQGSALFLGSWWWFIPPGLAITLIVGSLYFMNVGLDEVFNPRLRTS